MTNPLLEQFNHWIKQLETSPEAAFSTQLAQWQSWATELQRQAGELSQSHADLVQRLSQFSSQHIELLSELTRAKARGEDAQEFIERLRQQLHQFNAEQTLAQATLAHEFLGLMFTQTLGGTATNNAQLEQLRASLAQLSHPRFSHLSDFIEALLEAHQASNALREQLDNLSDTAIKTFCDRADAGSDAQQLLRLWVECYDTSYRNAFNSEDLQQPYAQLINAMAQLQISWQSLIDKLAEHLGLPSRAQVQQLIDELGEQRRRVRRLEQEIEALKQTAASGL